MAEIKKVSFIGLGALGILFGQHLQERMPKGQVTFIADDERIARYKSEGFYSNGKPLQFVYESADEKGEHADLIIFSVKYNGLQAAIEAVKNYVGENTIFLSALNGIVSEEEIGKVYGSERVIHSVAQGMDAVKVGNELTYSNMGMICFGDRNEGEISAQTKRLARFFEQMDFPHEIDKDMSKRMWGKFMTNVGVNQAVAVFKGNYGTIQQEGKARDTMIGAMREVIQLSEREGVNLTEADLQYWLEVLGTLGSDGKPSLAQDMEAKRYSEVELFAGTVVKLAKKHGIQTPVNKMFYETITAAEKTY